MAVRVPSVAAQTITQQYRDADGLSVSERVDLARFILDGLDIDLPTSWWASIEDEAKQRAGVAYPDEVAQ